MLFNVPEHPVRKPFPRCLGRPNCVSSTMWDRSHRVEPFHLTGDPEQSWKAVVKEVSELDRTVVVAETSVRLHAECRSRFLGMIDDLALELFPDLCRVEICSAARKGWWDFGINRRRVECLRKRLARRGVVQNTFRVFP
ncbi:MAG: DUF1499 domain-containing protein [Desulfovibrionales bacterium]